MTSLSTYIYITHMFEVFNIPTESIIDDDCKMSATMVCVN